MSNLKKARQLLDAILKDNESWVIRHKDSMIVIASFDVKADADNYFVNMLITDPYIMRDYEVARTHGMSEIVHQLLNLKKLME